MYSVLSKSWIVWLIGRAQLDAYRVEFSGAFLLGWSKVAKTLPYPLDKRTALGLSGTGAQRWMGDDDAVCWFGEVMAVHSTWGR
ncbi:uncharacterized protein CIMG_12695 [Coccidioides immitis RS]|uniref:Uncharacterized protein n=1 Tax=Coccidioides immitis (strain RS) TaxID=246410 RepID=J3KL67_COCIM|nr:uncharacterized protein CIMG_12695 [Coccidioides immitis RS]EAS36995.3 hypothetical protein CIMG_12695 [Coccidioides immitis RS]